MIANRKPWIRQLLRRGDCLFRNLIFGSVAVSSFFSGRLFSDEPDVSKAALTSFDHLIADPFWNLKSQLESAVKNAVREEAPLALSLLFKCAPKEKFRNCSLYECLRVAILACKSKEVAECLLMQRSFFSPPLTLGEKQSLVELASIRNPELIVVFSEYEFPIPDLLFKEAKQQLRYLKTGVPWKGSALPNLKAYRPSYHHDCNAKALSLYGEPSLRSIYEEETLQAIRFLAWARLKKFSFAEREDYLIAKRREIACRTKTPCVDSFEALRTSNFITNISEFLPYYEAYLKKLFTKPSLKEIYGESIDGEIPHFTDLFFDYPNFTESDHQKIKTPVQLQNLSSFWRHYLYVDPNGEQCNWRFSPFFKKLEELYSYLDTCAGKDLEKFKRTMAKFIWYYSHMMITERGSGWRLERFHEDLWLRLGLSPPKPSSGELLDCQALCSTMEEFELWYLK